MLLLFHGGKMQRRLDARVTHLVTMETKGVSEGREEVLVTHHGNQ